MLTYVDVCSGHLYIGNQKMSKSLKNFFTIRELLKGGSTTKRMLTYADG